MHRKIYMSSLTAWIQSKKTKPILLWGARQVGKTTIMRDFAASQRGTQIQDHVYLNFEADKALASLFSTSLEPERIVRNLGLYFEKPFDPKSTLLIFDEIQECEDALNSLKYFAEASEPYWVIAAGSLLGVKHSKKGFPVGKVTFLDVHPLSFLEFLEMTGHSQLAEYLQILKTPATIPESIHAKLLGLSQEYMWTGGMPEVVAAFAQNSSDRNKLRELQNQIIRTYQLDFAKHAPSTQIAKIGEIFAQLPLQIAKENKKFQVSGISKNARLREYAEAIQWLIDAGIVHKVTNIAQIDIPLAAHAIQNSFKLFLLDTGLLGAMLDVPPKLILDHAQLFSNYRGALAESFVAQQLIAERHREIYYWTSQGTAEVDFVIQNDGHVFPLEVKSGVNVRSKSLNVFGERYKLAKLARCSALNYRWDGHITNYPLYSIMHFPKWSS